MFFILYFLMLDKQPQLVLENTIEIGVAASNTRPAVVVDGDGNIYYRDYWEHAVYKLDKDGKLLFRFGRQGKGPGEMEKPINICLMEDDTLLLVRLGFGDILLYKTKDGSFVKKIGNFTAGKIIAYSQTQALLVHNITGSPFYRLLDLNGNITSAWFPTPQINQTSVPTARYAVAIRKTKTAFFQEGADPVLEVVDFGAEKARIWELKLPRYYRQPPSQKMPESLRFDRKKVDEFYSSFSQIHKLDLIEDKYLIIGWMINAPECKGALDIYNADTEVLMASSLKLKGLYASHRDYKLYSLEEIEDDLSIKHYLHQYRLVLE